MKSKIEELIRIGSVKDHNNLRLLTDAENEQNNHECGKLNPQFVHIGFKNLSVIKVPCYTLPKVRNVFFYF